MTEKELCPLANLPKEIVDKIHEYANLLLTIPQIAILLDLDEDQLFMTIQENSNPVAMAYQKGKAERILMMHQEEIGLAEAGSNQGVENLHAYLNQMNATES